MTEHQSKSFLRTKLLHQRKTLSVNEVEVYSSVIIEKVQTIINTMQPKSIHCYSSIVDQHEIITTNLINFIRNIPTISLTVGSPEPNASIPDKQYDMIIVPVVGYTHNNYRIGYGGGWYDRFIATQKFAFTIGLAYKHSRVTFKPEVHDQCLDIVVTE